MATFLVVDTESLQEAVGKAGRRDIIHVAEGAFRAAPEVAWDEGEGCWRVTGGDFRPPAADDPVAAAGPSAPGGSTIIPYLGTVHGNRMCFETLVGLGAAFRVLAERAAADVAEDLPSPAAPGPADAERLEGYLRSVERATRAYAENRAGQARSDDWAGRGGAVPRDRIPYDPTLRSGEIAFPSLCGPGGWVGGFPEEGPGARDVVVGARDDEFWSLPDPGPGARDVTNDT